MPIKCEYANRPINSKPIECKILKERKARWCFCINQYPCKADGNYKISDKKCALIAQKGGA